MWEMGAYVDKVKQSIMSKGQNWPFQCPELRPFYNRAQTQSGYLLTQPSPLLINTEPISQGYCTISHKVLRLLSSVSTLSDLRSVSSVTGRPTSYEQNEAY